MPRRPRRLRTGRRPAYEAAARDYDNTNNKNTNNDNNDNNDNDSNHTSVDDSSNDSSNDDDTYVYIYIYIYVRAVLDAPVPECGFRKSHHILCNTYLTVL